MKENYGFSLIEVLIVLLIVTVLITLSVIALAPSRRAVKTDDAVNMLFSSMRQARLQAITRRQFYAVVVNASQNNQTLRLNNSTQDLTFLANSISIVDMGQSTV